MRFRAVIDIEFEAENIEHAMRKLAKIADENAKEVTAGDRDEVVVFHPDDRPYDRGEWMVGPADLFDDE